MSNQTYHKVIIVAILAITGIVFLTSCAQAETSPKGIIVASAADSVPISALLMVRTEEAKAEVVLQVTEQITPQLTLVQNMHKIMQEARKAEQKKKEETQKKQAKEETKQTRAKSATVISITSEEIRLLEKLVMAEAGGEPYKGQVAVANVVINRVLSKKFPNTVKGVIYQKGQFSPVSSGSIHKKTPSSSVKKAVQQALSGVWAVDRNVLFFMTPEAAARTGIGKSHKLAAKIGNHVFYY